MTDATIIDSDAMESESRNGGLSALLRAAIKGNSEAYGRFLGRVARVLDDVIATHGRELTGAERQKILQDTLRTIHRKRHTWHADAPAGPWLSALACYRITALFHERDMQVSLQPDDFAAFLPTDSDRAAAEAAFGTISGAQMAMRWVAASLKTIRESLRGRSEIFRWPER